MYKQLYFDLGMKKSSVATTLIYISTIFLGFAGMTSAETSTQAVSQGYSSANSLQPGMIVRLDPGNSSAVLPLDQTHVDNMLGVVVSSAESAVTLGYKNNTHQVFVTNFGRHDVLVSNQNGPIHVGDYITISSINGIGMETNSSEPIILGQAAANFNGTTNSIGRTILKSSNGQNQNVNLGLIPVDISVANNPLAQGPKGLPKFLKKVTQFATNKSVSATRVYLSLFIVFAGVVLAITVIYASVKNGIISLGRNPLAKGSIGFNLVKLVLAAVLIFGISLGVAYAVLL